jgi:hypothetical protein
MTDTMAIPWYKSRILQGLLTIVVTQIVAKVQSQWHVDFMGISVTDIVSWLMNIISAGAVYWATHARVAPTVPIPPVVTGTQAQADVINSQGTSNAKATASDPAVPPSTRL